MKYLMVYSFSDERGLSGYGNCDIDILPGDGTVSISQIREAEKQMSEKVTKEKSINAKVILLNLLPLSE